MATSCRVTPATPNALKTNSDYFIALASSFEKRFGVEFAAIREGVPANEMERLRQFKTNIDIWLSALDNKGLGEWVAGRIVDIADTLDRRMPLRIETDSNPFLDERLLPANLPVDPVDVVMKNPVSGEDVSRTIKLFRPYGEKAGARRAISEMGAYLNYVTDNRFLTLAADLSGSINVEKCHYFGHYDPADNPAGTRLKAGIQEAGQRRHYLRRCCEQRLHRSGHLCRHLGTLRHVRLVYPTDVHADPGL